MDHVMDQKVNAQPHSADTQRFSTIQESHSSGKQGNINFPDPANSSVQVNEKFNFDGSPPTESNTSVLHTLLRTDKWEEYEEWEGFVQDVNDKSFVVGFIGNKDIHKIPKYTVEFNLHELNDREKGQLRKGSHILLKVGLKIIDGNPIRISKISLSNFELTEDILKIARSEVSELLEGLEWDESSK